MRPKEVVLQWIIAFNNKDIRALSKLFDESCTDHQVTNEPITGKETPCKYLKMNLKRLKWFEYYYIIFFTIML